MTLYSGMVRVEHWPHDLSGLGAARLYSRLLGGVLAPQDSNTPLPYLHEQLEPLMFREVSY